MTTYLKDFEKFVKSGVAYAPLGALEWHGRHLPLETDFLVALKLCELLAEKVPGYILPPIYLSTDKTAQAGRIKLLGMERHDGLKKQLPGTVYWLEPKLLFNIVAALVKNLKRQGFKKIFIVSGHAGSKPIEIMDKISQKESGVFHFNPYGKLNAEVRHADEQETSLFWACYPEEEEKSRRMKIPAIDDYFIYYGGDPRSKASLKLGRKILNEIIENGLEEIKRFKIRK